jgi:hypothetical protein
MGATCGAGIANPSKEPEFAPRFLIWSMLFIFSFQYSLINVRVHLIFILLASYLYFLVLIYNFG